MTSLFTLQAGRKSQVRERVNEPYLEAVFELLADKVEDDGVDAGVDCCEVDAQIIQHQQETERRRTDTL